MQPSRWSARFYAHAPLYLGGAFLAQTVYLVLSSSSILNPVLSMLAVFVLFISFFTPQRLQGHWVHRPLVASILVVVALLQLYFAETELLVIYILPVLPVAVLLLCRTWHAQLIILLFLVSSTVVVINPPPNLAQILASTFGYVLIPTMTLLNWLSVSLLWYSLRLGGGSGGSEVDSVVAVGGDLALDSPSPIPLEEEASLSYDANMPLNRQPMPHLPAGKARPLVLSTLAEVEFYHAFSTLGVSPSVHSSIESRLPLVLVGDAFFLGGLIRWLLLHQLASDLMRGLALNFSTTQLGVRESGEIVLRIVLTTGTRKNVVLHAFDPSNTLASGADVWRTVHVHRSLSGSTAHFVVSVRLADGDPSAQDRSLVGGVGELPFATRFGHARLLLAESVAGGACSVQRVIVGSFGQLWVASDAEEALLMSSRASFDLVLLDMDLLGVDGGRVVAGIRAQQGRDGRHVPIIGIGSAGSSVGSGPSVDYALGKPVDAEALLALMHAELDRRGEDVWT